MGDARADDDGAAQAIFAAADARTISAACCGLDGAALDADGAADGATIAAADARAIQAARGRDVGRAADGDVAGGGYVSAAGARAGADARAIRAALGRDVSRATDGDVAAGGCASAADARAGAAARGRDVGRATDADGAAGGFVSAADARTLSTALGRDVGRATDADGAAGGFVSAADARTVFTALGGDVAALDDDVSASNISGPADARAIGTARGRERARALDGERFSLGNKDARIIFVESIHRVRRAVGQDDGGIARAGKARPFKAVVVVALDVHAFEYYRRTVSNGDLEALRALRLAVEQSRHSVAVLQRQAVGMGRCIHVAEVHEPVHRPAVPVSANVIDLRGEFAVAQVDAAHNRPTLLDIERPVACARFGVGEGEVGRAAGVGIVLDVGREFAVLIQTETVGLRGGEARNGAVQDGRWCVGGAQLVGRAVVLAGDDERRGHQRLHVVGNHLPYVYRHRAVMLLGV